MAGRPGRWPTEASEASTCTASRSIPTCRTSSTRSCGRRARVSTARRLAPRVVGCISDPVSLDTGLTNHGGDQGGRYEEEGAAADDTAGRGAGGQRRGGDPVAVEHPAQDGVDPAPAPRGSARCGVPGEPDSRARTGELEAGVPGLRGAGAEDPDRTRGA